MPSLEHRLSKLEEQAPNADGPFEQFVSRLPPLDEHGNLNWRVACPDFHEVFAPYFADKGAECGRYKELADPVERGLADLLITFNDSPDPFVFERFRGRVPDRVLSAIYCSMRNYAYKPEVRQRIWSLAGLSDDETQRFAISLTSGEQHGDSVAKQ